MAGVAFLREAVRRMDLHNNDSTSSVGKRQDTMTLEENENNLGRGGKAWPGMGEEEEQGQTEGEAEEEERAAAREIELTSGKSPVGSNTMLERPRHGEMEEMDHSSTNPPTRAGDEEEEDKMGKAGEQGAWERMNNAKVTATLAAAAAGVIQEAAMAIAEAGVYENEKEKKHVLSPRHAQDSLKASTPPPGDGESPEGSVSSPCPSRSPRHPGNRSHATGTGKGDPRGSGEGKMKTPRAQKSVAQTMEEDVDSSFFLQDATDRQLMTLVMLVPDTPPVLADLIGKGGSTVGEIQRLTGTQVSIERLVHRGRERKVALMGSILAVATAQQIITARIRHLEEHCGVGREYVPPPSTPKGYGEGAGTLSSSPSSSTSSSASSSASSSSSSSPSFESLGMPASQSLPPFPPGHHHHHPVWKDAQGCLKLKLCVPNCTVRHLIGRAGTVVSAIERDSGCILKFQSEGEMENGALGRILEMLGGGCYAHARACYHVCRKLADDRTLPTIWKGGDVFSARQKLVKVGEHGGMGGRERVMGGDGTRLGLAALSPSRSPAPFFVPPRSHLSGQAPVFVAKASLGEKGGEERSSLKPVPGDRERAFPSGKHLGSMVTRNSSHSVSVPSFPPVTAAGGDMGEGQTPLSFDSFSDQPFGTRQYRQFNSPDDLLSASSLLLPSQADPGGWFTGRSTFFWGGGDTRVEKGGNGGEEEKGDGWGAGDVMMMMARVKEQEREMRENSFAWDAKGSESVEEEWSGSEVTENGRGAYQVVHVLVPNKAVSFLIGKAGINVIAIEKKSGAKVEFTREASPPAAERLVNIKGNAKAVKIAEALLEAKTLEWQTSPTLIR